MRRLIATALSLACATAAHAGDYANAYGIASKQWEQSPEHPAVSAVYDNAQRARYLVNLYRSTGITPLMQARALADRLGVRCETPQGDIGSQVCLIINRYSE